MTDVHGKPKTPQGNPTLGDAKWESGLLIESQSAVMVNKQETHLDSKFTGVGPKICLPHSSIFFFSHPSSVFTHSSPGERQSFEMKGILWILVLALWRWWAPSRSFLQNILNLPLPQLPLPQLTGCSRNAPIFFPSLAWVLVVAAERGRERRDPWGNAHAACGLQRMPRTPIHYSLVKFLVTT